MKLRKRKYHRGMEIKNIRDIPRKWEMSLLKKVDHMEYIRILYDADFIVRKKYGNTESLSIAAIFLSLLAFGIVLLRLLLSIR